MLTSRQVLSLGRRQLSRQTRPFAYDGTLPHTCWRTTAVRAFAASAEAPAASTLPSSSTTTKPTTSSSSTTSPSATTTATPKRILKTGTTPSFGTAPLKKSANSNNLSTTSRQATTASPTSSSSSSVIPSHILYKATTVSCRSSDDGSSAVSIPTVDWSSSFHGISSVPATKEQFEAIMRPLAEKEIEVKPDGIIYLPEIRYRRRLNEAFGPMGWGLIPKGETVVGDNIVTREYALIVGGRFVSQAQGENSYFGNDQLPSAVEGCKSNALMRCCKDLGIASELWDPAFIRWFKKTHMQEVWVEHVTTKKRRQFWYRKGAVEVAYPYRLQQK